jgi:hypothetical protein
MTADAEITDSLVAWHQALADRGIVPIDFVWWPWPRTLGDSIVGGLPQSIRFNFMGRHVAIGLSATGYAALVDGAPITHDRIDIDRIDIWDGREYTPATVLDPLLDALRRHIGAEAETTDG